MIPHSARLCLLALAAFFGFSATPWPALAISCDFTLTDLEFGVYDQVSGAPTDSTASLTVTCLRAKKEPAQVRYNLSLGPSGTGSSSTISSRTPPGHRSGATVAPAAV